MPQENSMATDQIAAHPAAQIIPASPASQNAVSGTATAAFGEDGFTFGDLVDIINPLQHIPIVSTIYRKITGDEIAAGSRVIGDGLFGGALGFLSGLVNLAVEQETGKDIGGHVMALFDDDSATADTQLASLEPKAGTASGGYVPAPALAAQAARSYEAAAAPDPIYGRTLDIGP
jgi:hypothetical protein